MPERLILTGQILTFEGNPAKKKEAAVFRKDGAVAIEDGKIVWVGERSLIPHHINNGASRHDYGVNLIMPGFVDAHTHYPQAGIIASFGPELLEWLKKFTFPEEARFSNLEFAKTRAKFFLDQLTANGVTTAAVYCTVHPESAQAFFEESNLRGLRMIAGKILMDRNAPQNLRDTPEKGYEECLALIQKWHNRGRCLYAVTPRFAPTSSPAQLEVCSALMEKYSDIYLQSHVSENMAEIKWVAKLFPESRSYLDVYARFNLLGPRSMFGHAIHMDETDLAQAKETETKFVHCPTSNLFMNSGLFRLGDMRRAGLKILLGSDVGGGTSFSPFITMKAAYEIALMNHYFLTPEEAFWMSSSGGAEALGLGNQIGSIKPGFEADLVVIDLHSTPLIEQRVLQADSLSDVLFTQMILADDRAIRATYANGVRIFNAKRN